MNDRYRVRFTYASFFTEAVYIHASAVAMVYAETMDYYSITPYSLTLQHKTRPGHRTTPIGTPNPLQRLQSCLEPSLDLEHNQ